MEWMDGQGSADGVWREGNFDELQSIPREICFGVALAAWVSRGRVGWFGRA